MKKIILLLFVIYSSLLAHTTNYGSALEGIGFMFVSLFIIGGLNIEKKSQDNNSSDFEFYGP